MQSVLCRRRKRRVSIDPLIGLSTLVALPVLLLSACGSAGEIADPWKGSWREIATSEAYVMRITPDGGAYTVLYRRSFLVPFSAYAEDDKLIVWGENTRDVAWTVTNDQDADQLTAIGNLPDSGGLATATGG